MAVIDDLRAAYAQAVTNLKDFLAEGMKPAYSIDGKSYDWTGAFNSYTEKLRLLKRAIQDEESPWQVQSQGMP